LSRPLVEFDWDRAFVATNLVVKPVADLLFLDGLAVAAGREAPRSTPLFWTTFRRDAERSRRWTSAS
jgi:toluene monooxygenase system protein E